MSQQNDVTMSFHAKYWAHALALRGATGSIEALSRSIAGSRVDLNPHQVDAALFAIRSPLTRGVILADEVGLGKTIEAGIVIAQRWAERKRRILVIVPATLRKQWQQELETKFYLSTRVLDSRVFDALMEEGISNPFDSPDRLVICSYHFASAKGNEVHGVPWDLVVIDEAHRLRNVYKKTSKLALNVANAVGNSHKLLLTATPLQNSLMELYGLASVIDDHIFGASDEVLGALESGVDIERRIAQVYQTCRNTDEIKTAFDRLQADLDEQIQARMAQTRQALLENFDEDVSARLRVHRDRTLESLGERERRLLELTRIELDGDARFEPVRPRLQYTGPHARQGWYHFDWKEAEKNGDTFYRQDHPLASHVIQRAISRELPTAALCLDYAGHGQVVSVLKPYLGSSGWLELFKLTVESFDVEEFLIFGARADDGRTLDDETCRKLMLVPAVQEGPVTDAVPDLSALRDAEVMTRVKHVEERNGRIFDEEVRKLDGWSDDLKQGLEREIKELDRQIREFRKTCALAAAPKDKLEAQKGLKSLEAERNRKRRELFDAQDAIDVQRDDLIDRIEKQLRQRHTLEPLFTFRWRLV